MGHVMHEFKHGKLKSGPGGKAGKVQSCRQAIAIALDDGGASKYKSERKSKRHLAGTERKEARGDDAKAALRWGEGKRQRTPITAGPRAAR
jgi:hypothetical protein